MSDSGILVLNAGSSSLKLAVFGVPEDGTDFPVVLRGQISGIGASPVFKSWSRANGSAGESASVEECEVGTHKKAIEPTKAEMGFNPVAAARP